MFYCDYLFQNRWHVKVKSRAITTAVLLKLPINWGKRNVLIMPTLSARWPAERQYTEKRKASRDGIYGIYHLCLYMPICVMEVAPVCKGETVSYVFKCRLCSHVSEKIKRTIDTRYIFTVLVHTFDRHFHAISLQTKSLCFWKIYMSFIVIVVTNHYSTELPAAVLKTTTLSHHTYLEHSKSCFLLVLKVSKPF